MIDKNAEINSFKFLHICCGSCILNHRRVTTEETERDGLKGEKKADEKSTNENNMTVLSRSSVASVVRWP